MKHGIHLQFIVASRRKPPWKLSILLRCQIKPLWHMLWHSCSLSFVIYVSLHYFLHQPCGIWRDPRNSVHSRSTPQTHPLQIKSLIRRLISSPPNRRRRHQGGHQLRLPAADGGLRAPHWPYRTVQRHW